MRHQNFIHMRKLYALLFISLFTIASCSKDSSSPSNKLNDSLNSWVSFKARVSNSYTYTVMRYAKESVTNYETRITVVNGSVIARTLYYHETNVQISGNTNKVTKQWEEDASNVGSHQDGAEAITLDEVYNRAKTSWLNVDAKTNEVLLETDNDGMISTAVSRPKDCQCAMTGIYITAITPLYITT